MPESIINTTSTGRPITVSAQLNQVREFFGITSASEMAKNWKALSDQDKADLKAGIGDGSLTY